jgi:hypothetical protein
MATQIKPDEPNGAPNRGRAQADDFAAWAFHQAMLLRAGQFHLLDIAGIAEELDGLGRGEYNMLVSQLRVVLLHLLKWDFQPERRSRSWASSIAEHRLRADDQLADNPSLQPRRAEAISRAYKQARLGAAAETDLRLAVFPETCPYEWQAIMERPVDFDGE